MIETNEKNIKNHDDKTASSSKRRKFSKQKNQNLANSLIGKCLVYIGNDESSMFHKSVVYVTDCKNDIIQGIMINKLLFGTAAIECKDRDDKNGALQQVYEDLYQGGPENPAHGFVLFPKDEISEADPFAEVHGDIAISTSFGILQEILDGIGPSRKIIAMGHCLWHRGELEWEIFNNQWLIVPSDLHIIFDTAFQDRWDKARAASGVKMETFIPQIGLA